VEIGRCLEAAKAARLSRRQTLLKLAQEVVGVYVPQFYEQLEVRRAGGRRGGGVAEIGQLLGAAPPLPLSYPLHLVPAVQGLPRVHP